MTFGLYIHFIDTSSTPLLLPRYRLSTVQHSTGPLGSFQYHIWSKWPSPPFIPHTFLSLLLVSPCILHLPSSPAPHLCPYLVSCSSSLSKVIVCPSTLLPPPPPHSVNHKDLLNAYHFFSCPFPTLPLFMETGNTLPLVCCIQCTAVYEALSG